MEEVAAHQNQEKVVEVVVPRMAIWMDVKADLKNGKVSLAELPPPLPVDAGAKGR